MSTFADAFILAGGINIQLERAMDPDMIEFRDLIAGYGPTQQALWVTHDAAGTLNVADVVQLVNDHGLIR